MKKSENIEEYDVLRVIVTILVLIGHTTSCQINTPYGGADYSALILNEGSIFFRVSRIITSFIYTFHMPLFFALSGALFAITLNKREVNLKILIKQKANRLLVPFFVVTVFYSVPIKYFANYFANGESIFHNVFYGQILLQGNTYLWFLPSLFFVFIVSYLLIKNIRNNAIIFVIFLLFFSLSFLSEYQLLTYVFQYGIWFYLGYIFEHYRESINGKLVKKKIIIVISAVLTAILFVAYRFLLKEPTHSQLIIDVILFCIPFFASTFIYLCCLHLKKIHICNSKVFKMMLDNSLGIYLYSDPWNYILLFVASVFFKYSLFNNNYIYVLFYISRNVITFALAIFISSLLRKIYKITEFKVLRFLI